MLSTQVVEASSFNSLNEEETTGVTTKEENNNSENETTPQPVDSTSVQNDGMYYKQSTGNTEMNSLCKFNIIFYLIYKHKYEEVPAGGEYLDFGF